MSTVIKVPGKTFNNRVDFRFPFASDMVGFWLFGVDEAASSVNLRTGLTQGSFTGSPTFSANGFTHDGADAKFFDSGIVQGGDYTIAAVSALPTELSRVAGFYSPSTTTIGTHCINSNPTTVTHVVNNTTRGTLQRSASSDGYAGQRFSIASFDGAQALLSVYEGGNPISPAPFPQVSTPPETFTFKVGGGNPAVFTGSGVANAAMLWNRALSSVEFDAVYEWINAKVTDRSVVLS